MLNGKKIVLGITGSIAAYKSCLLLRELVRRGAEVQVVITPAGKQFITPVTLSALSGKPVVSEFFAHTDGTWHSHVDLGLWADLMIIAPCTAASLGKMATGIADNMLITTYLSMKAPVVVAPAMDLDMYKHPTTRQNIEILKQHGVDIVEAEEGYLASGLEGKGRMADPIVIADRIEKRLQDATTDNNHTVASLTGKHVLITAGPTHEKIDPVRFIGNYSTGKMGFSLAETCYKLGAKVTLVAGPVVQTVHSGIERIDVESCEEMYQEVLRLFPTADIAILCAAVADYRPENYSETKLKRTGEELVLHLKPNPDIAEALGKIKTQQQILIGFALETNDEVTNAIRKLNKKNLDFIVLNSMKNEGTCFGSDQNQITIISAEGEKNFEKKNKTAVAADIVNEIVKLKKLHA